MLLTTIHLCGVVMALAFWLGSLADAATHGEIVTRIGFRHPAAHRFPLGFVWFGFVWTEGLYGSGHP